MKIKNCSICLRISQIVDMTGNLLIVYGQKKSKYIKVLDIVHISRNILYNLNTNQFFYYETLSENEENIFEVQ